MNIFWFSFSISLQNVRKKGTSLIQSNISPKKQVHRYLQNTIFNFKLKFALMDFFSAVLTLMGQALLLPWSSITPKFPYVSPPFLSWSVYNWRLEIFPEQGSLLLFPAHSLFSNEQWLEVFPVCESSRHVWHREAHCPTKFFDIMLTIFIGARQSDFLLQGR